MNTDDIIRLVRENKIHEHRHDNIELKADWSQKYGEKLSALGNKAHGKSCYAIIGISDGGALLSKTAKWAKQTEEVISQHINSNLDPIHSCKQSKCVEIDGSWVVIVTIENIGEVVYWDKEAYISSGTTIKAMNPEEILKLRIKLPGLTDFSRQIIQDKYSELLVSDFCARVLKRSNPSEYPENIASEPIKLLPHLNINSTQAARILFGSCTYRIIRYGSDREPIDNSKHIGLYQILTDEFISGIQAWTSSFYAPDSLPYPPRSLKETLANAIAHAAYFDTDGDIIIEMWPDRICVSNLCIRESTYFANRWFSRSHKTINGLLMETMRVGGLVDELGRGKNLIFAEAIKSGKKPPEVIIERAGKFDRWKLVLYSNTQDEKYIRLLEKSRSIYKDEQKALIAQALVLWRHQTVTNIRDYVDGDFSRQFAEVLSSLEGPIFFYKANDQITLTRWAEILIGEGKESKALSPGEEERLKKLSYDIQTKYHEGYITPKQLRKLAGMGESNSERVLSSTILSNWTTNKIITKVQKGQYKFNIKTKLAGLDFSELLKIFESSPIQPAP
jgi:predicted HTH transcriptional regulator